MISRMRKHEDVRGRTDGRTDTTAIDIIKVGARSRSPQLMSKKGVSWKGSRSATDVHLFRSMARSYYTSDNAWHCGASVSDKLSVSYGLTTEIMHIRKQYTSR